MADDTPSPNVADLLAQIAQLLAEAIQALNDAVQKTGDPDQIDALNDAVDTLTPLRNEVVHAETAADDAALQAATTAIKAQAGELDGISKKFQTILSDIATAGKIVGILTQAGALIAQL